MLGSYIASDNLASGILAPEAIICAIYDPDNIRQVLVVIIGIMRDAVVLISRMSIIISLGELARKSQ